MNRNTEAALEASFEADALAALRQATDSRHTQLDSKLPIGAADASLADYTAHLAMLRAWLGPLCAWLAAFDDGPQVRTQERLALIDADLREAAIDPCPSTGVPARPWPLGASAAYRWGVCYVVEGSQLGGAVLYQRLADRLAPHPLRYLKGDAAGPGPRWRAFTQALRASVRTPAEIAEACAGACEAFDRILAARVDGRG